MNDQIVEQEENADATTTETEEKATGTDQTKTAKTFSQEDVNKIVAKEKQAWKRVSEKAVGDHETIVEALKADITKRDEVIQTHVALLKQDLSIDEEDWELTMGDRDVLDQYQYLLKKVEKTAKNESQFPRTPKGKSKEPEFTTSFKANV